MVEFIEVSGGSVFTNVLVKPISAGSSIYDTPWSEYTFHLDIKNVYNSSIDLSKLSLLWTSSGGWVYYQALSPIAGISTIIQSGLTNSHDAKYSGEKGGIMMEKSFIITKVDAFPSSVPTIASQQQFVKFPIVRPQPSPQKPDNIITTSPVYIGLWTNPVELVPVWSEDNLIYWVTIAGQIVNGSGNKIKILKWHIRIRDSIPMDRLNENLPKKFYKYDRNEKKYVVINPDSDGNVTLTETLSYFIYGFQLMFLPSPGSVSLSGTYSLANIQKPLSWKGPIAMTPTLSVIAPVRQGLWSFNNGARHTGWDSHASPDTRFAFDMAKWDDQGITQWTSPPPGKPLTNSNALCWDQEILSMMDGEVLEFNDERKDHELSVTTGAANYIFIAHPTLDMQWYLFCYYHLKQDSIKKYNIKKGQSIKAGDVIGRIGNTGDSSGPHLHIFCLDLGSNAMGHNIGRGVVLPLKFTNIMRPNLVVNDGVPDSDKYWVV